jgi:hypothetical protein
LIDNHRPHNTLPGVLDMRPHRHFSALDIPPLHNFHDLSVFID